MEPPNILFLFSDEHSFRCMGHVPLDEGGEQVFTPNLDNLAFRGSRFSDTYCQMPLCTPSRITLLSAMEVRTSGAWSNKSVLRPELKTLPGVFRDSGYTTCLVGKMHLGGTQQFVGFQYRPYGDLTGETGHQWEPIDEIDRTGMRVRTKKAGVTGVPESLIQDPVVTHEAVAFLRNHSSAAPDKPWFLCASFSRPHFPLTPPRRWLDKYWPNGISPPLVPPGGDAFVHPMSVGMRKGFMADAISREEMMYARAAYFANVSYLDEVIGDFLLRLDASGLLDNTIIVYSTDHGEMAGEHGVWWKNGWYEACTRVPLIISTPEQRAGNASSAVVRTPVSLLDVFPTLCGLAGLDIPENLDGYDLSGAVCGTEEVPDRAIYCDALVPRWGTGTEFRMIRYRNWKYVRFRAADSLFFDLESDPEEHVNLIKRGIPDGAKEDFSYLENLALGSMDFEEAERERLDRDGSLEDKYAQKLPPSTGNLYFLPSGKIINADDSLYKPAVIAPSPEIAFGNRWEQQNKR